jgi:hypothetical protein
MKSISQPDFSVIEAEFGDLSQWQQCPEFWVAKPDMAMSFIESLREATVRSIGQSVSGRDIIAIEYGEKEPLDATNDNLQSSLAAKIFPIDPTDIFPPHFYGHTRRRKPVVVLQGGIHGGELTGTVASLNLCRIIENGQDLRGKEWPRLQELARETRLAVIPWLNPDATARWPIPNTSGVPDDLYGRCTQGVAADGTKHSYPEVKAIFPIPPDETLYMGTYYNDNGVNLQYDLMSVQRQPETTAWMKYYLEEKPDGVIIWHCNAGSLIGPPEYYLPEGMQHEISRMAGAVRGRLMRDGYNVGRVMQAGLPGFSKPFLTQIDGVYHICGATPVMVEAPAGAQCWPMSLDDMLDIGLITIEEILFYAHTDGLRPYETWSKVKKRFNK